MKLNFTLGFLLFHCIWSYGQALNIDGDRFIEEDSVTTYTPYSDGVHLYLDMSYGRSAIAHPEEVKAILKATILSIDIVYSDHPKGRSFFNLNKKRLANLKRLAPAWFKNEAITWRLVKQTDCKDKAAAQKLFHGIVISYYMSELDYFKEELSNIPQIKEDPFAIYDKSYKGGAGKGKDATKEQRLENETSEYYYANPVVGKALKSHDWTNMAIAADLTGSMSPYTAQLLIWLKFNTQADKVKQFVFFNDGNMTPDEDKKIGATGGLYDTRSSKFDVVKEVVIKTMESGDGGDGPENDIEALLKAIELCPDCSNIVLIADNMANIKDIELVPQLKKPIKIILCGTENAEINPDYLNLARDTGGSVHTMEDDLTSLINLHEGEEITIGGDVFKIKDGKFEMISKM